MGVSMKKLSISVKNMGTTVKKMGISVKKIIFMLSMFEINIKTGTLLLTDVIEKLLIGN